MRGTSPHRICGPPARFASLVSTYLREDREFWPRLAGLLASFVFAGASAVTYRLWPTPASAQAAFQRIYYENLAEGHTASEAFRQARQEVQASLARTPSLGRLDLFG
jgi:hypothetical protein